MEIFKKDYSKAAWQVFRHYGALIPILLLAGLIACSESADLSPRQKAHSEGSLKPFHLQTPEGESKTLNHFLNQVTLVNFFFPTCGPCNAEFPHLQKIYEKYYDKGFSMVAINIIEAQKELVPKWRASHGYTFPVLVGLDLGAAQRDYGLEGTPLNYLINVKGEILFRDEGYSPGAEKELEERIRQVLDSSSDVKTAW